MQSKLHLKFPLYLLLLLAVLGTLNKMASLSRPSEFALIEKYMRPLSKKESGGGLLLDDAAVLSTKEKQSLVVTMDTLVSGIHFLEKTPPQFIASKILRNLYFKIS